MSITKVNIILLRVNETINATITYIDNKAYGRIGTCRTQDYQEQYEEAYGAIIAKYPELIDAKRCNGRIEICE